LLHWGLAMLHWALAVLHLPGWLATCAVRRLLGIGPFGRRGKRGHAE
jgi:hypothetical protein